MANEKTYMYADRVKFKVGYIKDYKGTKHMKEGDTLELHPLHADVLEQKGAGKVLK